MPNWIESMNKLTGPRNFAEAYGIVTREGVPLPSGHPCAHGCRMNLGRVGIDRSCQLSGCAHDTVNEAAPINPVAWANLRQCTMGAGCDEVGACYAEAHGAPERCARPVPGSVVSQVNCVARDSCKLSPVIGYAHPKCAELKRCAVACPHTGRPCTSPTQCSEPAGCVHTRADPWDSWKSGRDL